MNSYGVPYNPNYAPQTGCPPYAGPQYPLAALTGQFRGLTPEQQAAADKAAADKAAADAAKAANPNPAITSPEWWKQTTFDIPRWALAGGAASLGLIAYLWSTGMFGGRRGSSMTVRRTRTAGDFSLDRRRSRRRRAAPKRRASSSKRRTSRRGRRDHTTSMTSRPRASTARRTGGSGFGRDYGLDFDL